ncbi:ATP-grasp domain-containing protein [Candidatus Dojkabacteria bacterium]|nr:ATP-grasp domain-containing protein [Candidatus Dojkabacteria bacterium]
MKILLITPIANYIATEITEEALKRGHSIITTSLYKFNVSSFESNAILDLILEADIVYIRTGPDDISTNMLREFIIKNNKILINSDVYVDMIFNSKYYQLQKVGTAGLCVPKTIASIYGDFIKAQKTNDLKIIERAFFNDLVQELSLPFIIKPVKGARGYNIHKIQYYEDFSVFINKYSNTRYFLFQEFIPNNGDYRVIVVGGKVVGMFKRIPNEGEFRANISRGGSGEIVTDRKLVKKIGDFALKACKVLEIEIGGVDVMLSEKNGMLYFIEVNRSMQWKGFERTTGINVAAHIVDYFESLTP